MCVNVNFTWNGLAKYSTGMVLYGSVQLKQLSNADAQTGRFISKTFGQHFWLSALAYWSLRKCNQKTSSIIFLLFPKLLHELTHFFLSITRSTQAD